MGAGFERHIDAGDFLGHGEARDVGLLGSAAGRDLRLGIGERKAKRGKLAAGERRRRWAELRLMGFLEKSDWALPSWHGALLNA
jgi:hypothetical protein